MSKLEQTKQAYAEIDEFIKLLNEEERSRIPQKIIDYFRNEKDQNYHKEIYVDVPIDKQNLKEETLALIAVLYLDYICDDDSEKDLLNRIYQENENNYQKIINEKYNPDNLFKDKKRYNNDVINNTETAMKIYKESFFKRFLDYIKKILKVK